MSPRKQTPDVLLVQALKDIIDPISYIKRTLPGGHYIDWDVALREIETRRFYVSVAKDALAAYSAATATRDSAGEGKK